MLTPEEMWAAITPGTRAAVKAKRPVFFGDRLLFAVTFLPMRRVSVEGISGHTDLYRVRYLRRSRSGKYSLLDERQVQACQLASAVYEMVVYRGDLADLRR